MGVLTLIATLGLFAPAEPPIPAGGAVVVPRGPVPEYGRVAPEQTTWVEHVVLPGETVEQVAARYGASVYGVKLVNELRGSRLRAGTKLRVKARRVPAPRVKVEHTVGPGETWLTIAALHRVDSRALKGWNRKTRKLKPGAVLTVWHEPDAPRTVYQQPGPALPLIAVRDGAVSLGRPARGRLKDAVRLPDSYLYTIKNDRLVWGSSHAVRAVLRGFAAWRHDTGFRGRVHIGSMSRRHGRRFPPHSSHRSGRDLDVFLPLLPHVPFTWTPNPHEIDWEATYTLIRALADTGQVEMIFLATSVQRYLYEAGLRLGASPDELGRLVGWPRTRWNQRVAVVRHEPGHVHHFHLRIKCGPDEDECYSYPGDERFQAIKRRERTEERRRAAQ